MITPSSCWSALAGKSLTPSRSIHWKENMIEAFQHQLSKGSLGIRECITIVLVIIVDTCYCCRGLFLILLYASSQGSEESDHFNHRQIS